MAKSLKERLIEQAEKLEKAARIKASIAKIEGQIRLAAEAAKLNGELRKGQPPK